MSTNYCQHEFIHIIIILRFERDELRGQLPLAASRCILSPPTEEQAQDLALDSAGPPTEEQALDLAWDSAGPPTEEQALDLAWDSTGSPTEEHALDSAGPLTEEQA